MGVRSSPFVEHQGGLRRCERGRLALTCPVFAVHKRRQPGVQDEPT